MLGPYLIELSARMISVRAACSAVAALPGSGRPHVTIATTDPCSSQAC